MVTENVSVDLKVDSKYNLLYKSIETINKEQKIIGRNKL